MFTDLEKFYILQELEQLQLQKEFSTGERQPRIKIPCWAYIAVAKSNDYDTKAIELLDLGGIPEECGCEPYYIMSEDKSMRNTVTRNLDRIPKECHEKITEILKRRGD